LDSDKNLPLEKVSTETIILWGENDTITPPRQAHVLAEKLKNSELKLYKNWTHAPYISSPASLASAILEALK
ncbi:alpha/beta hydrolase, partial [Candidatus Saccharibacteria bacterium]|nr:alpha/beta hydrolase [Candidatus Saccharibacteria bacterium]